MYHLISIILKQPDILVESDPLEQILSLWKAQGALSSMMLSSNNLENISHYYHYVCDIAYHHGSIPEYTRRQEGRNDHDEHFSFLFEPTPASEEPQPQTYVSQAESHRLLLTILDGTAHDVDELLDATEEIISQNMLSGPELIFVLPVSHVRSKSKLVHDQES